MGRHGRRVNVRPSARPGAYRAPRGRGRRCILRGVSVGRNDPCPCGSGKKFKVCCLRLGRKAPTENEAFSTADLPARFRESVASILSAGADIATAEVRAAVALAGELCLEDAAADDEALRPCHLAFAMMSELIRKNGGGEEELVSAFLPRLPFDVVLDDEGRTAGDLLLERHGATLPEPAREAVRALVAAEDALCRVEKAGGRVFIEDLGTGTRLPAAEAFRQGAPGLTARLVRYRGRHVPLDPELVDEPDDPWYADDLGDRFDHAEDLLTRFGLRLRSRMKGGGIGGELVKLAFGQRPDTERRVPDVRNAEGHRLVFTTLRWDIAWEPGARASLATVEGLELEETATGLAGTFLKKQPPKARKMPGETITVGALKLEDGMLVVETSSAERAERLRKKLDKALGKTATFRSITSEPVEDALGKPVDPVVAARRDADQAKLMALPEVREALAKMGRDHSLAWCDMVIPALGNRRPRTLVKTESGRRKVEALLAEFADHQARQPDNPSPMDLGLIRRELGLDRTD